MSQVLSSVPQLTIAGHDCLMVKVSKAPAPEAFCVYLFDKAPRAWVNVCPEPQPTEQEAMAIAEAILTDADRYTRCILAAVQEMRNDKVVRLEAKCRRLESRIEKIERERMAA